MRSDAPRHWKGTFAPEEAAAREARAGVEAAMVASDVAADALTVALVVLGELVGNAIRHARTDFTASAAWSAGTLRLEVFDRDTRPPALMGLDADSTSGRGLHIVAGLSTDWGWSTAEDADGVSGKVVWAEVALDRSPEPAGE